MSVYFYALLFSFGLMGLGAIIWVWFEDRRDRAPRIAPPIENMTRDKKLAFAGKVKQQIRVVDLSHGRHERQLPVIPEDMS